MPNRHEIKEGSKYINHDWIDQTAALPKFILHPISMLCVVIFLNQLEKSALLTIFLYL